MPISGFKDKNGTTHWTAVCNRCLRVGPPRLDREEALRAAGIGRMPNTHESFQCIRGCEPRVVDPEVEPNAPCPSCGYHLDRAAVLNDEAPYVPFAPCPRCGATEEPPQPGLAIPDSLVKAPFAQQVEVERLMVRQDLLGSVWHSPVPTDGSAIVTDIEAVFSDDGSAANFMVILQWEGTQSQARVLLETLTEEWTQQLPTDAQMTDDMVTDEWAQNVLHMMSDQHESGEERVQRLAVQVQRALLDTTWRHRERGIIGLVTDFHIPEDDPGEMTVTLIPQDIRDPIEEGAITISVHELQQYWHPQNQPMMAEDGSNEPMMMEAEEGDADFALMAGRQRVGAFIHGAIFEYDYGDVQGTLSLDWLSGQAQHLTLIGNLELEFTNLPMGISQMVLRVEQDWAGGHEIRWPASVQRPSSSVCNGPPGSTTLFPLYCAGNGLVFMQEPIRYPYQVPTEMPQVQRGIYRLNSDPGFHVLVNYSGGSYHNAHIMGRSPNTPNTLLRRYFRHIEDGRELTGAWCRADRTSDRVYIIEYDDSQNRFVAEDGRGSHRFFHVIDFLRDYRRVGAMGEDYQLLHNPAMR